MKSRIVINYFTCAQDKTHYRAVYVNDLFTVAYQIYSPQIEFADFWLYFQK